MLVKKVGEIFFGFFLFLLKSLKKCNIKLYARRLE